MGCGGGATAGEEEEVGGAAAFGRQSATSAVRRWVALNYTTLSSYSPDMYEWPQFSLYSRDVYNFSTRVLPPIEFTIFFFSLSLSVCLQSSPVLLQLYMYRSRIEMGICFEPGFEDGLGELL